MPLTTLERQELRELIKAIVRGVDPDADLSPYSDWDIDSRVLADLFMGNQHQADYIARQIFLRSCADSELEKHARSLGTAPIAAQKAVGKLIVTSTSDATPISKGDVLLAPDGTRFIVSEDATTATSAASTATAIEGSDGSRLLLTDTTGIVAGDIFDADVDYGGVASFIAIRGVLTGLPMVELFREIRLDPSAITTVGLTAQSGALVSIIAEEAGAGGNQVPWSKFSWEDEDAAVAAGLGTEPILCECGGGGDEESPDELRARLISWRTGGSSRAREANESAWVRWCQETPNARVDRVYVFPNLAYLGVQTIICEGVAGARELPSEILDEIEAYLGEVAPPSEVIDLRTRVYGTGTNVDVTITPAVGYEPDWGPTLAAPSTPGSFTIDTGSTVDRVQVTTDPTGVIEPGDRILLSLPLGSGTKPVISTVTAVAGGGSPYIDVAESLPVVPTSFGIVLPGSPIAQDLIDAFEEFFENLGPGRIDSGVAKRRFPQPFVQGPAEVSIGRLYELVMAVEGVENASFADPVADITPSVLETVRMQDLLIRYEAV